MDSDIGLWAIPVAVLGGAIRVSTPFLFVSLGEVLTEGCVQTTMREANDRGFECLLAEDAAENYFPEFKADALSMIRAQGAIVGWTATVDQIGEARISASCIKTTPQWRYCAIPPARTYPPHS